MMLFLVYVASSPAIHNKKRDEFIVYLSATYICIIYSSFSLNGKSKLPIQFVMNRNRPTSQN